MKAKYKITGEMVEVIRYGNDGSYTEFINSKGIVCNLPISFYDSFEEVVEDTIDWELRRYEIAKGMMPQVFHYLTRALQDGAKVEGAEGKTPMEVTAERAVWFADALIAELKKERKNGTETNQDSVPATEG